MGLITVFGPEAETHYAELCRYITDQMSLKVAQRFTDAIVDHCFGLNIFPNRGFLHDDLRPGLRTISFCGCVTIAYAVDTAVITALAIRYTSQDIDAIVGPPDSLATRAFRSPRWN